MGGNLILSQGFTGGSMLRCERIVKRMSGEVVDEDDDVSNINLKIRWGAWILWCAANIEYYLCNRYHRLMWWESLLLFEKMSESDQITFLSFMGHDRKFCCQFFLLLFFLPYLTFHSMKHLNGIIVKSTSSDHHSNSLYFNYSKGSPHLLFLFTSQNENNDDVDYDYQHWVTFS